MTVPAASLHQAPSGFTPSDAAEAESFHLITTPVQLAELARRLEEAPALAVDLEADSMFHFREKVCLLQITTGTENFVLDPLALPDLEPLKRFFADPRVQKVFHGADYDVRSLHRDFGIELQSLFDTELACRFLGHQQSGLNAVLQARFGVALEKKYQKRDWSQRPLPPEMLAYAAADVSLLLPLAAALTAELKAAGRLSWVQEECDLLTRVRVPEDNAQPLFLRFKGAGRLDRATLAVLEALLQLRQSLAAQKDRPPFKVLSNAAVMKLAQARPRSLEALKATGALSPKQVKMLARPLLATVAEAEALPPNRLPRYPRTRVPAVGPEVANRAEALKRWREKRGSALGLSPGLLCNNTLITALAARNPRRPADLDSLPDLKNWQKQVFGDEILQVLRKISP
ncbi:MAG: HRDC domain-containing protein [Desulfobacteraceae bacterium]|nr:HRDC domain-containing protein [Desulfobacteraceae bacterium]